MNIILLQLLIFLSCGLFAQTDMLYDPFETESERRWNDENPQLQKDDSTYLNYWCSIEILKTTNSNINNLDLSQIADFLATFHPSCNLNVEYSEWSNELLFKVLLKHPDSFLKIIQKNSLLSRQLILNELKSPIADFDVDSIIKSVQAVDNQNLKRGKEIILSVLQESKNK